MPNRRKQYKDQDKYRKTTRMQKERYRLRTGSYLYPRRLWEDWEDELILKRDNADIDLSVVLERSVQAIQVRRWRLKRTESVKNEI